MIKTLGYSLLHRTNSLPDGPRSEDGCKPRPRLCAIVTCLLTATMGWSLPSNAQRFEFREVGLETGLQFLQVAEDQIPIGAGAVWADFDGDGWDDVFVAQAVGCNRLFLNDQEGGFVDQLDAGGAADCDSIGHGAGVADFDNDGDQDLYVTNHGQNRFYANRLETGLFRFDDITDAAGMGSDGADNSASAVWGDYNEDGFVDLFVAQHVTMMEPLICAPDLLWHNNGDGTFTEVGMQLGVVSDDGKLSYGCGLAATWSDYDNDGDVDLMVINDFGDRVVSNRLFINDGMDASGFVQMRDISAESGFDYEMFGMGIAIGDIDRDGDFDYYMTDIGDNNLALNNLGLFKKPTPFVDLAASAGVLANDQEIYLGNGLVSWGPVFADVDHDGWVDLFVANGGAPEDKFEQMFGESYIDLNPNYSYRNLADKTFNETHEGIGLDVEGYNRSFTYVDYDRDGDLDLYIANLEGNNFLFQNQLAAGSETRWVQFDLEGTLSNRDALGARVILSEGGGQTQMREVDGGSSFLSANSRIVHFGAFSLLELERVTVEFLNGIVAEYRHLPTNKRYELTEPVYLVEGSIDEAVIQVGDDLLVDVATRNRTNQLLSYDFWIEMRTPMGEQRVLAGPKDIELLPGQTFAERQLVVKIPDNVLPGLYEVILRVGDFETGLFEHQDFIDVVVE